MEEPYFDLPSERKKRRGCSRRTWIILLLIVVIVLASCLVSRIVIDRYQQRQRILQRQSQPIAPPRGTPVIVGTPGPTRQAAPTRRG